MLDVRSAIDLNCSDDRTFLRLVRKMASLNDMKNVEHLDTICRNMPRFLSFKLQENYCYHCDEYQQGKKCRKDDCKAKKRLCIPKDNTLGLFDHVNFSLLSVHLERLPVIQTNERNYLFLLVCKNKD